VPEARRDVRAEVVELLRDEQLVVLEHSAERPRDLCVRVVAVQAAGHVRDVDAPAVEAEVEPAARDREHPKPQLVGAPVQLREAVDAEPGLVAVRERVVEVVEGLTGGEPVVADARVVRGQVAEDADPAGVGRAQQRGERLVAAEQRVDAVEGRRVVPVLAARREERRQVDHVRAERLDVVEMRLDAEEVAAVELVRGLAPSPCRELVPGLADRPLRRRDIEPRRRETVGVDLVDDRADVPLRAAAVEGEDEVVGVGYLVREDPEAVQPGEAEVAAGEQPAVPRPDRERRQRRAPPSLGVGLGVERGREHAGLAVVHVAEADRVDGRPARHAEADRRGPAGLVRPLDHVRVRAVVVRLGEQRRDSRLRSDRQAL
jgi:hypothetical protein